MKNNTGIGDDGNLIFVREREKQFFEKFLERYNINWSLDQKKDNVIILSRSMVGIIKTPERKIEIAPKYKEITLDHVLRLYFYVTGYENSADDGLLNISSNNNLDGIIKRFINRLENAVLQGLPKEYIHQIENVTYWKGLVDVPRSVKNSLLHKNNPVHTRISKLSIDSSLNQLLKAALEKIKYHSVFGLKAKSLLSYFENVSKSKGSGAEQYATIVFNSRNSYLKPIAMQATLILDELYMDTDPGSIGGESFLINFDMLFEAFIRKILTSQPEKNFGVWKDSRLLGTIYNEGTEVGERIYIPDIIYKEQTNQEINGFKSTASAVIDVKNKAYSQFKPADIYQISLYSAMLHVKDAILVYPSFSERSDEVMNIDYEFVYLNYLYAVFINIAAPSSEEFKKSISDFVEKVLTILESN